MLFGTNHQLIIIDNTQIAYWKSLHRNSWLLSPPHIIPSGAVTKRKLRITMKNSNHITYSNLTHFILLILYSSVSVMSFRVPNFLHIAGVGNCLFWDPIIAFIMVWTVGLGLVGWDLTPSQVRLPWLGFIILFQKGTLGTKLYVAHEYV